jgi:ribosomal protein L11 methyltransferase
VLAELLELAPSGVEQVDGEGFVEFALYGAPGELPDLPPGAADIAGIHVQVSGTELDDDWADRWREFHQPILIADRLFVRPPWSRPRNGSIDIVIDPAQAFGTGGHPTTRLSLELLLDVAPTPLVDLGCGSGVLAIAAAKLGFAPITALDNDPAAIDATRANRRANGVTLERVERYDLRTGPAPVAAVMTANLVRPLLLRVAELLPEQPAARTPPPTTTGVERPPVDPALDVAPVARALQAILLRSPSRYRHCDQRASSYIRPRPPGRVRCRPCASLTCPRRFARARRRPPRCCARTSSSAGTPRAPR